LSAWAKILGRTERIGRREIDLGPKELPEGKGGGQLRKKGRERWR